MAASPSCCALQVSRLAASWFFIYKNQGLASVAKQHKRVKYVCLLANENADKVSRFFEEDPVIIT